MKLLATLLSAGLFVPFLAQAAEPPRTLFELAGAKTEAAHLKEAVLVIIDAQREYLDGRLPLFGMGASVEKAARLLERARRAGTPVVHVVHRGKGPLFDPAGPTFQIVPQLRPAAGEAVVEKTKVNAFTGTELEEVLARTGRKKLIVIGYMTHNCVSTTARAAVDHGYAVTIVASATATRDLPDGRGGVIPAATVQAASLASLSDRTAVVVPEEREIAE